MSDTLTRSRDLAEEDFRMLSNFIEEHYGIQLPSSKKKMVEARLQKRLKALGLDNFSQYFEHVFGEKGASEYGNMIDHITTNKTEFFREPAHFDFLSQEVIPEILRTKSIDDPINIWSAACSSGEEVYSILITLEEYFFKNFKKHPYNILATDLSVQVLKKALRGVYPEDRVSNIPLYIKKRYFQRSKRAENILVRIKPEFSSRIEYKRLNLLKPLENIGEPKDIIFCRNVLIYFNREIQEQVITKLLSNLKPNGYLFIGHAESLSHMKLPLLQVRPTMFKKIK